MPTRIDDYLAVAGSQKDKLYTAQRVMDVLDASASTLAASNLFGYSLNDTSKGGAEPNGVDDTTTINNVHSACLAAGGVPMLAPAGRVYHYNGSGLDNGSVRSGGIIGAEPQASQIIITQDTASLFKPSQRYDRFVAANLTCSGGFGLYRNTATTAQVAEKIKFDNVEFLDYVGAAIASETSDSPYLTVTRSYFKARDYAASMGISWTGHNDNMYIAGNAFVKNRVHIKMVWDSVTGKAPTNGYIVGNDLIRLATRTSEHAHGIWLVPAPATSFCGFIYVDGNKYGSENLQAGDQWVIFADEDTGTGTDHATRFPDETTTSTGTIYGFVMNENNSIVDGGTASSPTVPAIVYSTTVDIRHSKIAGTSKSVSPTYFLQLSNDPAPSASATSATASRFNQSNQFGPLFDDSPGISVAPIRDCNYPGMGIMLDPSGQQSGRSQHFEARPGGQNPSGYADLISTRIRSYNTTGTASKSDVADSQGLADATEVSLANGAIIRGTLGTFTSGKPVHIEFDLRSGQAGSPLAEILVRVRVGPGGAGNFHFDRIAVQVPPNNEWGFRRFFFVPREAVACEIQFANLTGATGTVQIGRVNVYHAREPVSHGPVILRQPDGTIKRLSVDNTGTLVVT